MNKNKIRQRIMSVNENQAQNKLEMLEMDKLLYSLSNEEEASEISDEHLPLKNHLFKQCSLPKSFKVNFDCNFLFFG